jgi:hypothetical protein
MKLSGLRKLEIKLRNRRAKRRRRKIKRLMMMISLGMMIKMKSLSLLLSLLLLSLRKKNLLPSPLLSLMSRSMNKRLTFKNFLKKSKPSILTVLFGILNPNLLKLPTECKSFRLDVWLKTLKSVLKTFSNKLKDGKKFNPLIQLASKSFDHLYLNVG